MATSIAFGLGFSAVLVLFFVPALLSAAGEPAALAHGRGRTAGEHLSGTSLALPPSQDCQRDGVQRQVRSS